MRKAAQGPPERHVRIRTVPDRGPPPPMQILNTLTVLALVVASFALIVAVPVLYASSEDSGRSNRLILIGGLAWVGLVLLNWGMSYFVA
jgi:photosystem II PsbZ protein